MVEFIKPASTKLTTDFWEFMFYIWELPDKKEYIALTTVWLDYKKPITVRVHSECLTWDIFKSQCCDCWKQRDISLEIINRSWNWIFIYDRQEWRWIGLYNKIKALELQKNWFDTYTANNHLWYPNDAREYSITCKILKHFKAKKIRLITNNPDKINQIWKMGIEIIERVPIIIKANEVNKKYLHTKKIKWNHML